MDDDKAALKFYCSIPRATLYDIFQPLFHLIKTPAMALRRLPSLCSVILPPIIEWRHYLPKWARDFYSCPLNEVKIESDSRWLIIMLADGGVVLTLMKMRGALHAWWYSSRFCHWARRKSASPHATWAWSNHQWLLQLHKSMNAAWHLRCKDIRSLKSDA